MLTLRVIWRSRGREKSTKTLHIGLAEDAQSNYTDFTEISQRTRRGLAENSQFVSKPTKDLQRTRRGFAKYSPRTHSRLAEESHRIHRELTEDSHRTHRGLTVDSQGTHRDFTEDSGGFTEDSQRIHRGLTEDSQRIHSFPRFEFMQIHTFKLAQIQIRADPPNLMQICFDSLRFLQSHTVLLRLM